MIQHCDFSFGDFLARRLLGITILVSLGRRSRGCVLIANRLTTHEDRGLMARCVIGRLTIDGGLGVLLVHGRIHDSIDGRLGGFIWTFGSHLSLARWTATVQSRVHLAHAGISRRTTLPSVGRV